MHRYKHTLKKHKNCFYICGFVIVLWSFCARPPAHVFSIVIVLVMVVWMQSNFSTKSGKEWAFQKLKLNRPNYSDYIFVIPIVLRFVVSPCCRYISDA